MLEIIFLLVIGLIWIIFATIQDLKTREVANWLNFSLIIFALGFRFFYSLFNSDWNFLFQGLIGFGIFFVMGNIFYYSRVFAGGDAKLMIALGPIFPLSYGFFNNLNLFLVFLILFLIAGAVYGSVWSIALVSKNFKKFRIEFKKKFSQWKKFIFGFLIFSIIVAGFGSIVNGSKLFTFS